MLRFTVTFIAVVSTTWVSFNVLAPGSQPGDVKQPKAIPKGAQQAGGSFGSFTGEYQVTVQSAKEPVPALKYQLAFELREQIADNAALHYLRAAMVYREKLSGLGIDKRREDMELEEKWLLMPLPNWPRAEIRAHFGRYNAVYSLIERAAKCEYCNWSAKAALQEEGVNPMLPEIQEMRMFAHLLRYKIRLELADGDFAQAAHWLKVGFTLARHAGEGPTLIHALVGLALCGIMDYELRQFIAQAGAPNMYWALTDLPRPIIDFRKAFQGERLAALSIFPGLRELAAEVKGGPMTAMQVGELTEKLVKFASADVRDERRQAIREMASRLHGDAKKLLAQEGRSAGDIEKLPALQAVLLLQLRRYEQAMDDVIKLQSLPYYEAAPLMRQLDKRLKAENEQADPFSLMPLVPACHKVRAALVRIERDQAVLRCVEAVRLYAAGHGGKPPTKLEDIGKVPIPRDPFTGKHFHYKAEGDTAIIEGPAPEGETPSINNYIHFTVTLKN